jgi:hypothetical protein
MVNVLLLTAVTVVVVTPDVAEPPAEPLVEDVVVDAAVNRGKARSLTTVIEADCTISTLALPVAVPTDAASAWTPGDARTAAAIAKGSWRFIASTQNTKQVSPS